MSESGLSARQALARGTLLSEAAPNADRRIDILEATCRIISRVGIAGASLESVAIEAGVSRPLVYYYFGSRDELLSTAFTFIYDQTVENTLLDLPSGDETEQVKHVLLAELRDVEIVRNGWRVWNEIAAAAFFNPQLRESSNKAATAWVAMVADLIRKGQRSGSISRQVRPTDAAERLTAIVDSLGTKWMLGGMSATRARKLVRAAVRSELRGA